MTATFHFSAIGSANMLTQTKKRIAIVMFAVLKWMKKMIVYSSAWNGGTWFAPLGFQPVNCSGNTATVSSAPIGYKHIKSNPKERIRGDIIIDEERAPIVKRLFEEYSTGAYTLSDMTRKAKEWGLKSPRSNKNFLSKSQIQSTMQNPFYCGEMLYKNVTSFFRIDTLH
ncbi:MAG: recombinase family protein [Verrucomicrobiota bacterium]